MTYEVVLDNSKMLMNCFEEAPPATNYEMAIYPTNVVSEGSTAGHSPWLVGTASAILTDTDDGSYAWSTWNGTFKGVYPLWTDVDPMEHGDTVIPSILPEAAWLGAGGVDPDWVTKIACRFRAKSPDGAVCGIQLFANVSKLLTNPSYGTHPTIVLTDSWTNYEWEFHDSQYSTGGWAPDGIDSALNDMCPGYLYVRTVPLNPSDHSLLGDYNIQVSKQHLVLYFTVPPELVP